MRKPQLHPQPIAPNPTDDTIIVSKVICSSSDRTHYYPGWEERDDEDDEEEDKEYERTRYRIPMSNVIRDLPKDISLNDVYFSVHFDEDYLTLKACYDSKVNLYDEQMKKYQKDMEIWNDRKKYYDQDLSRYEDELKKELASLRK